MKKKINFFLLIILLTAASFLFREFQPNINKTDIFYGIKIFYTCCYFSIIGNLIVKNFPKLYFYKIKNITFGHNVLIGQTLCILYIYIRSFINNTLYKIPITIIDFVLIFLVILFFTKNKPSLKRVMRLVINPIYLLLILVFICLSSRELPRKITYFSPDTDIHSFNLKQMNRFGTIPNNQEYWGPDSLNYPSGFSSLNFVWSKVGNFNEVDMVTIQPLIQTQVAILVIFELVFLLFNKKTNKIKKYFLSLFLLETFYFLIMPYCYQNQRILLAGTGRLSSLSFFAGIFSIVVYSFLNKNKQNKKVDVFLMSLLCVSIFLINILQSLLVYILLLIFLIIYIKSFIHKFFLLIPQIIIFFDPYFQSKISKILFIDKINNINLLEVSKTPNLNILYTITTFLKNLITFSKFEMITNKGLSLLILCPIIYYLLFIFIKKNKNNSFIFFKKISLLFFYFTIISVILLALVSYFSPINSGLSLFSEYSIFNLEQFLLIFIFFITTCFFIFIFSLSKFTKIIFIILLILLIETRMLLYHNGFLNFEKITLIRKNIHPSFSSASGGVYQEDLNTIKFIEKEFLIYKKNNKLTFDSVPKILIPNSPFINDLKEKWLFQYGATRVLPFYEVFPVAFYYGEGSSIYSFDNYYNNVFLNFNTEWLKQNNIKYIFLPQDRKSTDNRIFELNKIIETKNILYKDGNSMFIELF